MNFDAQRVRSMGIPQVKTRGYKRAVDPMHQEFTKDVISAPSRVHSPPAFVSIAQSHVNVHFVNKNTDKWVISGATNPSIDNAGSILQTFVRERCQLCGVLEYSLTFMPDHLLMNEASTWYVLNFDDNELPRSSRNSSGQEIHNKWTKGYHGTTMWSFCSILRAGRMVAGPGSKSGCIGVYSRDEVQTFSLL